MSNQDNSFRRGGDSKIDLSLENIYFTIFRHKWKIFVCTVLGIGAAIPAYFSLKPSYVSEARLLIKYVERDAPQAAPGANSNVRQLSRKAEDIIASELQILTSNDLIEEVADNLDPIDVVPEPPEDATPATLQAQAAGYIKGGLNVRVPKRSTIISISYQHPNPQMARPILAEIINTYLRRHLETHQSSGEYDNILTQQTDQLRARLKQTEEELLAAKAQVGIISIDETRQFQSRQLARLKEEILKNQSDLNSTKDLLEHVVANPQTEETKDTIVNTEPDEKIFGEYQRNIENLKLQRAREQQLLVRYTAENPLVEGTKRRIQELETEIDRLVKSYPYLITTSTGIGNVKNAESLAKATTSPNDLRNQILFLETKNKVLNEQLSSLMKEVNAVNQAEISIRELNRRKELDESNYKNFMARLEKERIESQFGNGQVSGINIIQNPSPTTKIKAKSTQLSAGIAVGGLVLGLAWAFLIELFLDRSIKRPKEVEKTIGVPLFLSIPDSDHAAKSHLSKKAYKHDLLLTAGNKALSNKQSNAFKPSSTTLQAAIKAEPEKYGDTASGEQSIDPRSSWKENPVLLPYYEALRDRMISFFESRGLTHKPKLIGLTGLGANPGVTTTAAGLASCLSKTEEGNVLLVDMTLGKESAQKFYKGEAVCDLDDALESSSQAQLEGNLYLAAEGSNGYKIPKILPNRFNHLVPKLRASDFDYIIFDMPEISPISATPRLSRFMDAMLVVIEAEKTDKEVALNAIQLLESNNNNVGTVLNKTRRYVPHLLQQDFQGLS